MKYVIIGNSTAAVGAIEGIRQMDGSGEITVISNEKYHTYSRPLISYLLQGKTDMERMKYRPADFYEKNGCRTILGKKVIGIRKAVRTVLLDDGSEIPYDRLMTATGSSPFIPGFDGLDSVKCKFTFMTLEDAFSLREALGPDKRVLIIGAGLIGLKCAEGIADHVKGITVVDLSTRILSSILDDSSAAIVQKHIEKTNIAFILGQSVSRFDGQTAYLSGGGKVDFDILVAAVGVRPNVSLISDIGGETDRGIVTDEYMRTSIEGIYAAGDCTESYDVSCGQRRVLALLPNAYRQGECAGINMAGGERKFDRAIPMNAIGFFGLHVITAGSCTGEVYEEKGDGSLKKLFYDDDLLKGYILVRDVEKAGIYTSLIQNRVALGDIDFELICEKPSLMAFSRKYRQQKLGGVV
ncbi:MAG: NAD(P)/FAD-dependent oxidoreductase [Clostridiaceae bacterium]|nr:NAD(P)/FAD-dependent oxidoreductase [Clostridiaceae bacterium]